MTSLNEYKTKNQLLSVKPFVYNRPSISAISIRFLILLGIQVLMLLCTKSFNSIFVILSAVLGAVAASLLNSLVNKTQPYEIMNLIIQGLFFGLLLPESYPPLVIFFISFATLFVSRALVFKSINCWINIPVVAVIIAWFIGRKYFPTFTISSGLITLRNSSVYLIQNGEYPIYSFDSSITLFLNSTIFKLFKISIPEGFISLLWDTHSTIPAFRFNIITIISSIFIFSDNSFSGIIPTLFLIVYAVLVRLFVPMIFGGIFNQGDVLLALLTSGTLFGAVYLIQWYGTVPISLLGKTISGILSGIIAFGIIGCGTSPIGMAYTVLLSNIVNMFIRIFEEKNNQLITAKVITKLAAKGEVK